MRSSADAQRPHGARTPTADTAHPFAIRILSVAMLLVAVAMIGLAVPRVVAGISTAPHGDAVASLSNDKLANDRARVRALTAYERAQRWHDNPQVEATLGALQFAAARQAYMAGDLEAARRSTEQSAASYRAALAGAPLQPYAWTQLVRSDVSGAAPTGDAVRHLRAAILSGPWEPALALPRLALGFAFWNEADADVQRALEGQARYAARFYPAGLARLARQRHAEAHVLQSVESDPDLLRRFSLAYSRL